MAKPLLFMMGRSPVFLPVDRRYCRNHMWAIGMGDATRFGFTAYAVKLLGDVRRLDWCVAPGQTIDKASQIGFIEASKATSDLYAPLGGRVVALNDAVVAHPPLLNSELYEAGWLFALAAADDGLLSPEEYLQFLEACWPLAERLLKGYGAGQPPTGQQR